MGLSDIAAGIEVCERQRESGVPTVDATADDLRARLDDYADALPCTAAAAAVVLESYAAGTSVGDCADEAGIAPMTAAKLLHRCGVTGLSPLARSERAVLRDWLAGDLPRSEARELVAAPDSEFALAAYVETHDPVPALADAVRGVLEPESTASVDKRDALDGTMSSVGDLR
jgi:hypothetical protein